MSGVLEGGPKIRTGILKATIDVRYRLDARIMRLTISLQF